MAINDWDLDRTVKTYRNDVLVREARYYKNGSCEVVYEDPNFSFTFEGDIIDYDEDDEDGDVGEETDGDDTDDESDDGDYENESTEARLMRIFETIAAEAGFDGNCKAVEEIFGESMQAAALYTEGEKEIQVTRSLIWSSSDDELAFIIGHEIAHHMNGDHDRHKEVVRDSIEDIAQSLDNLNDEMKQKGRGVIRRSLTLAGSALLKAGTHSRRVKEAGRTHEEEADQEAVDLIVRAGYSTAGVESVLRKLHGGHLPDIGYLNTLTSTHPNPATRAKKALRRAPKK